VSRSFGSLGFEGGTARRGRAWAGLAGAWRTRRLIAYARPTAPVT